MSAIKTLTAVSIGLAAAVPAAHADRGDRYPAADAWRNPSYARGYDEGRSRMERHVVRRDVIVERRPVVVRQPPARLVMVERPVYVQPAPAYREPYPRYYGYEARPVVNAGVVLGAIGGAVVGSMIGGRIGYGEYQGAAAVAGAVIGGAIGREW